MKAIMVDEACSERFCKNYKNSYIYTFLFANINKIFKKRKR